LTHASLAHLSRVWLSGGLAEELLALKLSLPFRSIGVSGGTNSEWLALTSVETLPALVEVFGAGGQGVHGLSLSEGAQRLIAERPDVHVRKSSLPFEALQPMSAEEHAKRLRRWTDPPGPYIAGPRFDDGWR
jgi:hypothetical protein